MQHDRRLSSTGLYILLLAQILPSIDFSIVNVTLESLTHSIHADHIDLELVVAVYGVGFAVCLAMGGRLGDNYGRRHLLNIGVFLFGLASFGCGFAQSIPELLIARTFQGIAAALIIPQILATIHVTLSGRAHSKAIGIYGAVGGLAFVLGQVLGGWLVDANIAGLGWRSVFLINLPLCCLFLMFSRRFIPESAKENSQHIDWQGTLILAITVLCLLIPMALGPLYHWSAPYIMMLVFIIPLSGWLWRVESSQLRRGLDPLLSPQLIQLPSIRFGMLLALLFFSAWSGFMFTMSVALQAGGGLTPLESGNCFIGLGLAFFIGNLFSAKLSHKMGVITTLLLGCGLQIPGLIGLVILFHQFWPAPNALNLLSATILIGLGQSFIFSSFFRISLSQVEEQDAGTGSAILSTMQQISFGLGSTLLGGIQYYVLSHGSDQLAGITAVLWGELILMAFAVIITLRFAVNQQRNMQAVQHSELTE